MNTAARDLHDTLRPLRWEDDALLILDQRRLPQAEAWIRCTGAACVAAAIRDMAVRGAPAIGIAAAYGAALSAARHLGPGGAGRGAVEAEMEVLAAARPTAVNLFWALERMRRRLAEGAGAAALLAEARAMHEEDIAANRRMGALGAERIAPGSGVLTHCNTGSLATGGFGTALGVIRAAWSAGRLNAIYAGETRPWLQGARLTAWELLRDGLPVTLLAEGAAAALMRSGRVQWVVVGADRIAANGDVANKIGTYALAVLAREHGVRFMVVAPTSTVDLDTPSGAAIPIETRDPDELLCLGGRRLAPEGAAAWNPVFDVTPAALVDVLVTERGVLEHPGPDSLLAMMKTA